MSDSVDLSRVVAGTFCVALGLLLLARIGRWWHEGVEPLRTAHSEFLVGQGIAHGILRALLPIAGCLCFGGLTAILVGLVPDAVGERPAWLSIIGGLAVAMLACAALIVLMNRPKWLIPPRHRSSPGVVREWLTRRNQRR